MIVLSHNSDSKTFGRVSSMKHRDITQRLGAETPESAKEGHNLAVEYAESIGIPEEAIWPAYLPRDVREIVEGTVMRCVAIHDGLSLRDNPETISALEILERFHFVLAAMADEVINAVS
jgi:hypothetical protein